MRFLPVVLCLGLTGTTLGQTRQWTNTSGKVIDAEYLGTRGTGVILKLKDGREVAVDLKTLSAADQGYVSSNEKTAPSAPGKRPGFNDLVIDKRAWVMRPQVDTFGITAVELPRQLETPHFLITAGGKVKPPVIEAYAEVCERLYAQMTRDLPGLEKAFQDRRMSVWLSSDKEEHRKLGAAFESIGANATAWDNTTISSLGLPKELAEAHKVLKSSRGFNTGADAGIQRNFMWPERIHFLASSITPAYGHPYRMNGHSFGMFNLCYSYYLEASVTGKVESKVSFNGGSNAVEGFKNSRGWPEATRRLLGSTPLRPGLQRFLTLEPENAEPMDLGSGFGMMQWIFRDPLKAAAFNKMLEATINPGVPPTPAEFATSMGFSSADAFDQAWLDYLKSDAFK